MEEDPDINDIFDDIVLIEDRFVASGFREGFQKGSEEGRQVGLLNTRNVKAMADNFKMIVVGGD